MRIFLLALPFIFSSCLVAHYTRIGSSQLVQNEKNDFVFENDTLRVVYSFNGSGGPLRISIENKSPHSLQVDWKKSALISEGHVASFYRPAAAVNGNLVSTGSGVHSITGRVTGTESIEFLPPGSVISRRPGRIGVISADNKALYKQPWISEGKGYRRLKYKELNYPEQESPLKFRSFITILAGPGEGKEITLDHSFYVSSRIAYMNREMVPKQIREAGNTFAQ